MAAALFVALAAAVIGGVIAAAIDGSAVTIGTVVAFLGVYGLAARNAILFVRRAQDLEDAGEEFGPELVATAAAERMPATVLTAVLAAVVFLPFVVAGSRAGLEIVHPMAVVIRRRPRDRDAGQPLRRPGDAPGLRPTARRRS